MSILLESDVKLMENDELIEAHQESVGYDAFCEVFHLEEEKERNKQNLLLLKKEIMERYR